MPWSRVLTFNDPVACQAALLSAPQAKILPTARGSFQVGVTQIGINKLQMQRFEVALPQVITFMTAPDRKVVGFLVETSSSNLQHCGVEVTPSDIFVYDHGVKHQRSTSNFHYATMSLPETDFHTLCKAVTGNEFLEGPRTSKVRPDPALMARLRKLHKVVGQLAHDTPDLLEQPEVGLALEEHLIHIMVQCLAEGVGVEPTTRAVRHHRATMVRLEEFLDANLDRPLYVTEICTAIGVSERTLRSACEEHLGMGPIRYLTLRRMHLARQALLRADPSKATVTCIVTDHGFWELGRFSVAYRALFGETPSETLRHPADHVAINHNRPSSLPAIELFSGA